MQGKGFGYFRLHNQGKIHYVEEISRESFSRTLCGRCVASVGLIPADGRDMETDLCKRCRSVVNTEFWGWEQMV
jgi:uncharacterized CHY-type Zn-finger protein